MFIYPVVTNTAGKSSIGNYKQNINKSFITTPNYMQNVNFRSNIPVSNLLNDYRWFINCDRTPAINAFLKINAPKEELEKLLKCILESTDTKFEFIESIVTQPREMDNLFGKILDKLPKETKFLNLYNSQNPYMSAYKDFASKKLAEANSIDELLKIRPDWNGEILLQKYKELHGDKPLELGEIPDNIGTTNYKKIIEHLKKYVQLGCKSETKIDDLDGFKFKNIIDGKTEKNVFEVTSPTGHKYIVKVANPQTNSLDGASALGTCCKIDMYLTSNKCRNSAPLKYYNHGDSVAIYDYIKHIEVEPPLSMYDRSRRIPDLYELGLNPNDTIGVNNYFTLDSTQYAMRDTYNLKQGILGKELISVDNDHCTYDKKLSPKIYEYFHYLPNGIGNMFF